LLHWSESKGIDIETISEHVPPFDDVFIKVMQDNHSSLEEA
jgi:hypothetical protein